MSKKKILVIDDEEFIRDLVKEFLEMEDILCFGAETSRQGLNLIAGNKYDLILLDRNLEKIKTEETISKIRAIAPDVPIVILTGDSGCDESFLETTGANGIIFKPFLLAELVEGISAFL